MSGFPVRDLQVILLAAASDITASTARIVYKTKPTTTVPQYTLGEVDFRSHHWGLPKTKKSKFAVTTIVKFFLYLVKEKIDLVEIVGTHRLGGYGWKVIGIVARGILPESSLSVDKIYGESNVLFRATSGELLVASQHKNQWDLTR